MLPSNFIGSEAIRGLPDITFSGFGPRKGGSAHNLGVSETKRLLRLGPGHHICVTVATNQKSLASFICGARTTGKKSGVPLTVCQRKVDDEQTNVYICFRDEVDNAS